MWWLWWLGFHHCWLIQVEICCFWCWFDSTPGTLQYPVGWKLKHSQGQPDHFIPILFLRPLSPFRLIPFQGIKYVEWFWHHSNSRVGSSQSAVPTLFTAYTVSCRHLYVICATCHSSFLSPLITPASRPENVSHPTSPVMVVVAAVINDEVLPHVALSSKPYLTWCLRAAATFWKELCPLAQELTHHVSSNLSECQDDLFFLVYIKVSTWSSVSCGQRKSRKACTF